AHDRGTLLGRGRPAEDARAVDVQDPGGQRLPAGPARAALRRRQRRGHGVPLEGGRRTAAAARVLGVLRAAGCDRERPRRPRRSCARSRRSGSKSRSTRMSAADATRVLESLLAAQARGGASVMVVVASVRGSTPRGAGARMLVTRRVADGAFDVTGTIGGGHL